MKFGVVVFPGSNCDEDMFYTLKEILGQETVKLWHKDRDLQGCDFIMLPGGFSYGDYLRSGAIARFSPIMESVVSHADKGGYVMGVCNGFQVLTEAELLPGALLRNNNQKFVCKNQFIKPFASSNPLTSGLNAQKAYNIPIAHADGRYFADDQTLKTLQDKEQILFQYSDENAVVSEEFNPNGSVMNIAGVCNEAKNVFGMMPHPERATDPILSNEDGAALFESLLGLVK